MAASNQLNFNVYGFQFSVSSDDAGDIGAMVGSDFRFFQRETVEGPLPVQLHVCDPPYEKVPPRVATVYTPRNIAFSDGPLTYIDYSGRALAIYNRAEPRGFSIYSKSRDLLYEATYLFLLSQIGEYLDARAMHRIHAMALSHNGRAVLAILPMGGGKSTLAAELLAEPDFDFLSDDSPFIGKDGRVHAFPLRLGLLPGEESAVPESERRTIQRMEFGPKVLMAYEYFAHRVKPAADPGIVFLGYRSLSDECRIEPVGWMERQKSILVNCVVGLGLFQGLEFILRKGPLELAGKARAGLSRWSNANALFRRSEVYRLILGRNRKRNGETVANFVRNRLSKTHG